MQHSEFRRLEVSFDYNFYWTLNGIDHVGPSSAQFPRATGSDFFHVLSPLHRDGSTQEPDYGVINYERVSSSMRSTNRFRREIRHDDDAKYESERAHVFDIDAAEEEEESYFRYETEYDGLEPDACRKPKWAYTMKTNCNSFHEQSWSRDDPEASIHYLGGGYYRDTYLVGTEYVIKSQIMDRMYNRFRLQKITNEAAIFERLTGSSHVSSSYGHCAFSIMVELAPVDVNKEVVPHRNFMHNAGEIRQDELDVLQERDVYPMNNYTAEEKLDLVTSLASSIAEIHGLETGPILLGDVSLTQWLQTIDGRTLLNDFDNVELIASRSTDQGDFFCPFWPESIGGLKAPEELLVGGNMTERADIWKFGGLVFSVLTGLQPYYDELYHDRDSEVDTKIQEGIAPYIDPRYGERSLIESRLVQVMNLCYKQDPLDRPSIFEILQLLQETREQYKEPEETEVASFS